METGQGWKTARAGLIRLVNQTEDGNQKRGKLVSVPFARQILQEYRFSSFFFFFFLFHYERGVGHSWNGEASWSGLTLALVWSGLTTPNDWSMAFSGIPGALAFTFSIPFIFISFFCPFFLFCSSSLLRTTMRCVSFLFFFFFFFFFLLLALPACLLPLPGSRPSPEGTHSAVLIWRLFLALLTLFSVCIP
ncbi:hypothetical protein VTK26DRAFT_2158 [Humicola hyalothermophila]